MDFEIQIRATTLADAVKQIVADELIGGSLPAFVGQELQAPYPGTFDSSTACLIDHISIDDVLVLDGGGEADVSTLIRLPPWDGEMGRELDVSPVVVDIQLGIKYAPVDLYLAAGPNSLADSAFQAFALGLSVRLILEQPIVSGAFITINARVLRIALTLAGGILANATVAAISPSLSRQLMDLNRPTELASLSPAPIEINLRRLVDQAGDGAELRNAGSKIEDGVFMLHIQAEGGSRGNAVIQNRAFRQWEGFFEREEPRLLEVQDFGLFLPNDIFVQQVENEIVVTVNGDPKKTFVDGGAPQSRWSVDPAPPLGSRCSAGGRALMRTSFTVNAEDACPTLTGALDIEAQADIDVEILLSAGGNLRVEMSIAIYPDDWDAFRCAFTNASLAGLVGFAGGGALGVPPAGIAIITAIVVGIVATHAVYSEGAPSLAGGDIFPIEGRDNAYYTETNVSVPLGSPFGLLRLNALTPCTDGLIVAGPITPSAYTFGLLETARLDDARFQWIQERYRRASDRPVFRAQMTIIIPKATSTVRAVVWALQVLSPSVVTDQPGFTVSAELSGPSIILRLIADETAATAILASGNREPIVVLLNTNRGNRILSLPTLEFFLSTTELDQLRAAEEARLAGADAARAQLAKAFESMKDLVGGVPEAPRSPLDDMPGLIAWDIVVPSPQPGFIAEVGVSDANGVINSSKLELLEAGSMVALVWEYDTGMDSVLKLRASDKKGTVSDIKVMATRYEGLRKIELEQKLIGHHVSNVAGKRVLMLSVKGGVLRYDIGHPEDPRLEYSLFGIQPPRTDQFSLQAGDKAKAGVTRRIKQVPQHLFSSSEENVQIERFKDVAIALDYSANTFIVFRTRSELIKAFY